MCLSQMLKLYNMLEGVSELAVSFPIAQSEELDG
jgi:hypothetical protein